MKSKPSLRCFGMLIKSRPINTRKAKWFNDCHACIGYRPCKGGCPHRLALCNCRIYRPCKPVASEDFHKKYSLPSED